jgi:hypothetical protein
MKNIQTLKAFQKSLAEKIKTDNCNLRKSKKTNTSSYINSLFRGYSDGYIFRHFHIAYCELRGKSRDQIEVPRENNEPNEKLIREIKEKYAWTESETTAYLERKSKREALRVAA